MANFKQYTAEFRAVDAKLIVASVEPRDVAEQLRSELGLDFPIGYGLNERAVASATGAFYEAEGFGQGPFLHATGFILDDDGRVRISAYSNGALGRLLPDQCLSYIDSFTGVPVGGVPTNVSPETLAPYAVGDYVPGSEWNEATDSPSDKGGGPT